MNEETVGFVLYAVLEKTHVVASAPQQGIWGYWTQLPL